MTSGLSRPLRSVIALASFSIFSMTADIATAFGQDCGAKEAMRDETGSVVGAAAKWDGVKAHAKPSSTTEVTRTIGFGESFYVYKRRASMLCLADRTTGKAVGWVTSGDFLTSRKARKHPRNYTYLKVMVRNNLEEESRQVGRFWRHPTRRDGPHNRQAGLYEVRYVFDIHESNGGASKSFLVGTGQTWDVDNAGVVLDGWISKEFVFPWNTRVGVQYGDDLRQSVRVYPQRDDLDRVHCGRQELEWAFSSLEDSVEWTYERERFPVISEAMGTGCLEGRHVLEIGGFGTVVLNNMRLSASEADKLLTRLNLLRGGNQSIDILFVIDGTRSAQPAFGEMRRAVQQVKARGQVDRQTYYGLMMFKDHGTYWPPRMTTRLLDADGFTRELDLYMKEAGPDTGDLDFSEAVLASIAWGLEEMAARGLWRRDSVRALVLLGDHGDHRDRGHHGRLTKVTRLLDQHRVRFFAYQTENKLQGHVTPAGQSADDTYRWFQEDATLIIDKMAEGLFPTRVELAHGSSREIAQAIRETRRWKTQVDVGYQAIREGHAPPSEVGPYILRMLGDKDIDIAQASGWGRAPQVCHEGFAVLEDESQRELFEKRIRVSYDEIAGLVVAFRRLLSDVSSETRCLRAMTEALEAATGDSPAPNESPASFLRRTLGIEVDSDLLTIPLGELARILASNQVEREKLRRRLERSVAYLDAVYREEEVREQTNSDVKVVYGQDGRPAVQKWFKVLPDSTRVAWIPANYIP